MSATSPHQSERQSLPLGGMKQGAAPESAASSGLQKGVAQSKWKTLAPGVDDVIRASETLKGLDVATPAASATQKAQSPRTVDAFDIAETNAGRGLREGLEASAAKAAAKQIQATVNTNISAVRTASGTENKENTPVKSAEQGKRTRDEDKRLTVRPVKKSRSTPLGNSNGNLTPPNTPDQPSARQQGAGR